MIVVEGITKDEFETWRGSIITQKVFASIKKEQDKKFSDLGRGVYLNADNPFRTQAKGFELSGKCEAFEEVLNMTAE
jgi:hypothetical protein